MKSILLTAGVSFICIVAQAQSSKNFIDQAYIEVSGLGDTLVTPNEIFVDVILSESDTKDRKSIEELEQTLIAALKSIGINTEKDFVTKRFDSKFGWQSFTTKVIKTKTYQIKVNNGLMLSKLFNTLEGAKIANTMVTKLNHTDIDNIQMKCRAKAMNKAKANAMALVAPLGQNLGPAIYINNIAFGFEKHLEEQNQSEVYSKKMEVRARAQTDFAGIELEQMKISELVEVKFILK